MTHGFLVAALLFASVGKQTETLPPCAAIADPALYAAKTWSDLHAWSRKWSQCDDGYLAEGVSDIVATWLAERWQTLPVLARETRDPKFKALVLRHVDELMTREQAAQIRANASQHCPTKYKRFCKEITGALDRFENQQRPDFNIEPQH